MKEQKKKKMSSMTGRKLRSAIVMALVCVMMLSGATYAWFTLSNTAKVNNLTLKVTSEGSLYVADSEANLSLKKGSLDLNYPNQVLYPCTTSVDGKKMLKPVYASDSVVGNTEGFNTSTSYASDSEKKLYYYEKEIWLKIEEVVPDGSSANVYAITLGKNDGVSGTEGTFVHGATTNDNGANPQNCVRVSFTVGEGDGATVAVYEPNSDITQVDSVQATDNTGMGFVNTHKQNTAGAFVNETGAYYEGDSSELFRITGNTPTKVTMRVWFEGTDDQCGNSIQDAQILSQLKFVSHKVN